MKKGTKNGGKISFLGNLQNTIMIFFLIFN